MKQYSLLVFDWDGTLVDSESLVIEAIQKVAIDFNHPKPQASTIRKYFGSNLTVLFQQFFPKEKQTELTKTFYEYFTEEKLAINFFQGALETLDHLKQKGFTLAIATNKARKKLDTALAIANIKDLFAATRCPEDGAAKPEPDILLSLLEELNVKPKNALMIGDTIFDMQFAQNASVDAIAVCYGHSRRDQLAAFNPVGFIENIQELKTYLASPI